MKKKTTRVKTAMFLCAACLTLGAMAAEVSQVTVRQRWPWSRLVDIDYVLACEGSEKMDIAISAYNGATPLLDLPPSSFSGDLYGVSYGAHHIVWDPTMTACTNSGILPEFRVALAPIVTPLYMIVDLTKSLGASGQIAYVTEADLTNDIYGAWARAPVTNRGTVVQSVIWTDVTNGTAYKTDKLVLRRIPAGSYYQSDDDGTKAANVTLTKGLYVGVFEVTQTQWNRVMGITPGTSTQAKHTVSYWDIREDPTGLSTNISPNWPQSAQVGPNSFMGKLRAMTGIDFDLPTEGQWEYACKAGTTTVFNDGNALAEYTGTVGNNNGNTNLYLNVLGWYKYNDPLPAPTAAMAVGGKAPNAWGLYDTHGNVWEWCLDWNATASGKGDDPKGADSGSARVKRGGSWADPALNCRSAFRSYGTPSNRYGSIGFRLVRTLP